MKTEILRADIEPDIKYQAENFLSDIGMTSSDAIRILSKQIALRHSFPIELYTPNQTTIDAMNDEDLEQISDLTELLNEDT